MDMQELQKQLTKIRAALNGANDETGPMRTREADVHMYNAFGALAVLESLAGGGRLFPGVEVPAVSQ